MQDKPINSLDYSADSLKEFQLAQLSIADKSSPDFGKKISKKIWGYVTTGLGGYYFERNARFIKNRNFANGRIDVQSMFQDRFQFEGKQNYIRLVWNTLQIVNRIVSGLVGRWMARGEKIVIQAIDDLSQKDKQEEYDQIEFIIQNRAQLEQLQQASGVQMIPNDTELPADKEELLLWKQQFQKTPEEIENELLCNEVLGANGWFDVLKEIALHDSAETGLVGTETYMDEQGVIYAPRVEPENAIYSASKYPDFRDATWLGEVPSLKISVLRRGWGKEFHPENRNALTEEQLWKIAQTAKEYQTVTNLNWVWDGAWTVPFSLRPYDEWNVRCMKFELKSVDTEPYTITTSKSTGSTYAQKGFPTTASGKRRDKPSDNQKVVDDTNINIYRGVYLPDNDILIEWGLKKNMIRPQDSKEAGNAEFSYSFYMYQNYQMRNLAIPEKIEAAIDMMGFACLKIQQDLAAAVPTGWAIDETALQNIDFGLGDSNKDIDHAKLFWQTGKMFYRGIDAEGNRIPVPITELQNSGFATQIEAFIRTYQFWYQTLKDELGEDPNSISAALQPRVTEGNVEASQQMSEFATDYMYRAYTECMKMTARKISCLGKDSIMYGSRAYRKIVKQDDIADRVFSTDIRFLPTQQEVARFESILNQAVASNPELLQFLDPFRLLRIAQEDVKLSELLFRQAQKKLIIYQQQTAAQNQQATFKAQFAAAQQKGQLEIQQLQQELAVKAKFEQETNKNKLKEIALQGAFQVMASKEAEVQPEWKPVINELIQNIMLPLLADNAGHTEALGNLMNQQQMQQQQQDQSQPQEQEAA